MTVVQLSVRDAAVRRGGMDLFGGLSFELPAGQALALTGPNGSGKTSLLRAIAGLVQLEAGEVLFAGAEAAEARAAHLHLVGHQDGLKSSRTVREELDFWGVWSGGSVEGASDAARRLDLVRMLDLEVRRLSAGQRRRLSLSRLLAAPRSVWLLDEPLSPLDARWRSIVGELMGEHLARGGLIVAAVHDPLPFAAQSLDLAA